MATHTPALALGPDDHGRPLSADEFAAAAWAEPWRFERVAGRLVVMSPDSKEHDDCSEPLRDHLGAYRLTHPGAVEQVVSECWIRVDGGTDRIGDIGVFLRPDRPVPERPDRVPDLIFEILSPGSESRRRDFGEKRREYYRLGVREYVVLDRFSRTATVFTRGPRGYRKRVLKSADTYTSGLLPGLEIALAEVF